MKDDSHNLVSASVSRRQFLKKSTATIVGLSGVSVAPFIYAKKEFAIRVLGTHVTLQEEIRNKAMQDLGIKIIFEPGGSAAILHRAATRPKTFDIYEQWSNSINVLWQAGSIQPLEINRIKYWDSMMINICVFFECLRCLALQGKAT
tara:strand:- start:156 stop:596 length:441 start_codon:yes stop_codon:yes gene_type:complete